MVALLDEWAARFFEELDYVREGENATRFAAQMAKDLPQVRRAARDPRFKPPARQSAVACDLRLKPPARQLAAAAGAARRRARARASRAPARPASAPCGDRRRTTRGNFTNSTH